MSNTTMRDKLSALSIVLAIPAPERPVIVQSDESLIRKAQKTAKVVNRSRKTASKPGASEPRASSPGVSKSPRYTVPSKKHNPFSYHVYSVEMPEEPPTAETVAQSPAVEQPPELKPTTQFAAARVDVEPCESVIEHLPVEEVVDTVIENEAPAPEKNYQETAPTVEPSTPAAEPSTPTIETSTPAPIESQTESFVKPEEVKEPAGPEIYIPPNLNWLQQPTPFGSELQHIVERVRNAKANIGFTLEQSLLRQKKLRAERTEIDEKLVREELVGEEQRIKLRQLDDMISACALVAEQSAGIDPKMFPIKASVAKRHTEVHHEGNEPLAVKNTRSVRWDLSNQTICRKADVLEFFAIHPNEPWTAPKIREELPEIKQEHAKKALSQILTQLFNEGKLLRLEQGVYSTVPEQ